MEVREHQDWCPKRAEAMETLELRYESHLFTLTARCASCGALRGFITDQSRETDPEALDAWCYAAGIGPQVALAAIRVGKQEQ